eukprot:GILI01017097.1.p1 GENE.GILI01017097.1~~GILI01017097.1.p1  ORF type:complete len:177 (+),score=6.95 GILI01017097.1:2-532(+)
MLGGSLDTIEPSQLFKQLSVIAITSVLWILSDSSAARLLPVSSAVLELRQLVSNHSSDLLTDDPSILRNVHFVETLLCKASNLLNILPSEDGLVTDLLLSPESLLPQPLRLKVQSLFPHFDSSEHGHCPEPDLKEFILRVLSSRSEAFNSPSSHRMYCKIGRREVRIATSFSSSDI